MEWQDEYNEFKRSHDWTQYKTRNQIDEVIVKKLSEMLNKQESLIKQLQNTSSNSDYTEIAKCEKCLLIKPTMEDCFNCFSGKLR